MGLKRSTWLMKRCRDLNTFEEEVMDLHYVKNGAQFVDLPTLLVCKVAGHVGESVQVYMVPV